MNDKFDGNAGPLRKRNDEFGNEMPPPGNSRAYPNGDPHTNGHPSASPVNVWTFLDLLMHRWGWLFLGGLLGAGGLFALGWHIVKPKYTATAQVMRFDTPEAKEFFFKDTPMSVETFAGLIRSPELFRRVGAQLNPPVPADKFSKCIKIDPLPDSELFNIFVAGREPKPVVEALNVYLDETVKFTKEFQQEQAATKLDNFLKKQIAQMDQDIQGLYDQYKGKTITPEMTNKLTQIGTNWTALSNSLVTSVHWSLETEMLAQQLTNATIELQKLSLEFKPIHPKVKATKSMVDDLKIQLNAALTNSTLPSVPFAPALGLRSSDPSNVDVDILRTKLRSWEDARIQLVGKKHEAEDFATNPPGMVRIVAPADMKTIQMNKRWLKISILGIFGALVGTGISLLLVMLVEFTDRRLKTVEDVRRVTHLPVLTTLGDLDRMSPADRSQWAFRTWTMLQGRLSRSANHGLVCGITSSANGEGRSTWISMLAEAASLTGFRVLTIATRPSPTHGELAEGTSNQSPEESAEPETNSNNHSSSLTTNVLKTPAQVTEQLTGPNSQPMVHIPLPGWVWNLERRKQWREALLHWRQIENLVILVELPPASVPEAVLLGSNLPNLIWLADSQADAADTRVQLETLRHARCNLVGAVVNREFAVSLKRRFPRWIEATALLMALGIYCNAQEAVVPVPAVAAAPAEVVTQTNAFFSVVSPAQRAAWQQHLTVGPGDILNFSLYGQPESARNEVAIPPDGYITFLEATNVLATGLTIDELRAKLDQELGTYRRAPRTIITPVAFKSKKYYMLGKVMTKGVYILDRPLTVLEAIARAHGFENGLVDRNIIELADFQRSFLMRGGKRYALNFEKLFQQGDLSQNIAIEPGDYLYFPSTTIKEVYVVGEVRLPGAVTYTPQMTIIGAISSRGGYTERAFKMRVLVVRGSINNPEAYAVDTHAILDARAPDFQLQPRDIIYVNSRPFIRVEELADLAMTAFLQSLITSWVGVDVVKPIQQ